MKIEKNKMVKIHYTLKDDDGNIIDSSEGKEALEYLQMQGTPQGEIILMKEAGWNGKNIPQTAKPVAQSVVL